MAGVSAERQETGFVDAVNKATQKNKKNPITVQAGKTKIDNVIGAKKYSGRQASGSEPYTDVILIRKNKKDVNLSLKGEAAPSLAGGGLRGLEAILPGITSKFMKAVLKKLLSQGLKAGDKVPDTYGQIDEMNKIKIVVGTAAMGGPIDYMYIGPMTVKSDYDAKTNVLSLNGTFTDSKTFAKTHDLYFRLRARREDQRFDPDASQGGIPKIYGKSPSRGDSAGRIVVTDKVPSTAVIVAVK
jgi:hypothetical protein